MSYEPYEAYQESLYDKLLEKWLGLIKDPEEAEKRAQEEFILTVNK